MSALKIDIKLFMDNITALFFRSYLLPASAVRTPKLGQLPVIKRAGQHQHLPLDCYAVFRKIIDF